MFIQQIRLMTLQICLKNPYFQFVRALSAAKIILKNNTTCDDQFFQGPAGDEDMANRNVQFLRAPRAAKLVCFLAFELQEYARTTSLEKSYPTH